MVVVAELRTDRGDSVQHSPLLLARMVLPVADTSCGCQFLTCVDSAFIQRLVLKGLTTMFAMLFFLLFFLAFGAAVFTSGGHPGRFAMLLLVYSLLASLVYWMLLSGIWLRG